MSTLLSSAPILYATIASIYLTFLIFKDKILAYYEGIYMKDTIYSSKGANHKYYGNYGEMLRDISSISSKEKTFTNLEETGLDGQESKFFAHEGGKKYIIKPAVLQVGDEWDLKTNELSTFIREYIGSKVYNPLSFSFPNTEIVEIELKSGEKTLGLAIEFNKRFKNVNRRNINSVEKNENFYNLALIRLVMGDNDFSPGNVNLESTMMVDAGQFGYRLFSDSEDFLNVFTSILRSNWITLKCNSELLLSTSDKIDENFHADTMAHIDDAVKNLQEHGITDFEICQQTSDLINNRKNIEFKSIAEFGEYLKTQISTNINAIIPALKKDLNATAEKENNPQHAEDYNSFLNSFNGTKKRREYMSDDDSFGFACNSPQNNAKRPKPSSLPLPSLPLPFIGRSRTACSSPLANLPTPFGFENDGSELRMDDIDSLPNSPFNSPSPNKRLLTSDTSSPAKKKPSNVARSFNF